MTKKPQILVACPPAAFLTLERTLNPYADLIFVNALSAARSVVRSHPHLAMVICGVHFDESRMFDLLDLVRREASHIPFVCVRVLEYEARHLSLEAVRAATLSLGAVQFINFPNADDKVGRATAEKELENVVLKHLRQVQP